MLQNTEIGQKVFHPDLGAGIIQAVEEDKVETKFVSGHIVRFSKTDEKLSILEKSTLVQVRRPSPKLQKVLDFMLRDRTPRTMKEINDQCDYGDESSASGLSAGVRSFRTLGYEVLKKRNESGDYEYWIQI